MQRRLAGDVMHPRRAALGHRGRSSMRASIIMGDTNIDDAQELRFSTRPPWPPASVADPETQRETGVHRRVSGSLSRLCDVRGKKYRLPTVIINCF